MTDCKHLYSGQACFEDEMAIRVRSSSVVTSFEMDVGARNGVTTSIGDAPLYVLLGQTTCVQHEQNNRYKGERFHGKSTQFAVAPRVGEKMRDGPSSFHDEPHKEAMNRIRSVAKQAVVQVTLPYKPVFHVSGWSRRDIVEINIDDYRSDIQCYIRL